MRPTDLGVKAPCNKTPAANFPVVDKLGKAAVLGNSGMATRFPSSARFPHYKQEAKKSGFRVGPGCYDLSSTAIAQARVRSTPKYKEFSHAKGLHTEGYYVSGHLLVYEEAFVPKHLRHAGPQTPGKPRRPNNSRLHNARCSLKTFSITHSPVK